jgi:hypothetical protein
VLGGDDGHGGLTLCLLDLLSEMTWHAWVAGLAF